MNISLNRRQLLRASATMAAGAAMGGSLRTAFAADTAGPILVMVHLRGGCDGLNLVSPATDPQFIAARVAELRVAAEGDDAGHALANGLDPKIDFRLHASAPELADIYNAGNLAVIHACGLTDANRSHFVATDMIERGVGKTAALSRIDSGWIARYLTRQAPAGRIPAASAGNALSSDFDTYARAVAIPNLDNGFGAPGGAEAANVLKGLYGAGTGAVAKVGADTLIAMHDIDGRVARDDKGKVIPYAPDANTTYDKAGPFGAGLKTLAQLIKMDVGLSVAGVDIGGWDTHEYQQGRFKTCVEQLSRGLGSFWNDLAAYHDRLTVVTVTEFGRRLRSNRSTGTDHGRACVMMVMGGTVAGGRMYGRWPGLDAGALDEGVDLAVTTDYRAVLAEVLQAHGRTPASAIFPDFTAPARLGLFKAET